MIKKGIEIKLNVQPVYIGLVHKYFFEGPCRMAPTEQLTPEFEQMVQPMMGNGAMEEVKAVLGNIPTINVLDYIYVQRDDEMTTPESLLAEITKNDNEVDLYLFLAVQMLRGDIITEVAERTNKPVMINPENCCMFARATSHVRAHGKECYAPMYWEDAINIMQALRLRKVMHNSNILQVTRLGSGAGSDITSNDFYNQHEVTQKLGVRFRSVNLHEVLDQFKPGDPTANHTLPGREGINPTEEEMQEIAKITDELVGGATFVNMERDQVEKSVRLWYTVQKFMDKHDCNIFTAPCPQFCATRRANEEQVTFCLTHSLNNEIGIPSSCEMDTIAALSEQLLISVSGCGCFMGESNPMFYHDGIAGPGYSPLSVEEYNNVTKDPWNKDGREKLQNLYYTFHAVPHRKMRGIDKPAAKYSIQPFAFTGWGATLRNDFEEDKEQPITMCRLSPNCDKLLIVKGTIVGSAFQDVPNCTHTAVYQVKDGKDLHDKQASFGTHLPMVYGDYAEILKIYAESVGLEVVEA